MPEVRALLFGLALGLAVGPISLLIMSVAARDGLRAGLRAAFGAGAADFVLAIAAFVGGAALVRTLESERSTIDIVSGIVLISVGLWLVRGALRIVRTPALLGPARLLSAPFAQTFGLTLVNPLGVAAFAAFSTQLPIAESPGTIAWLAFWLALGTSLIGCALAGVGRALQHFSNSSSAFALLNAASGLAIAGYGASAIARVL